MRRVAWALPAAFLAAFLAWPLLSFLRLAGPPAALGAWEQGRLAASLKLGLLTAALALAFGMPLAWLLGRHRFPGRKLLRALVTVPFVMPVVVVASGVIVLMGPRASGTYAALLVAHAVYNVPLVVRLVGDAWAHLDPRAEDAAATLGAGPLLRFTRVTLPRLVPAILAATMLAFLFGFTAFGTILLLADPVRDATLEVAVYHEGILVYDLPVAATLALIQLAVTFLAALAYAWLARRAAAQESAASEAETLRPLSPRAWPLIALAFGVAAALLSPLAAVLARALETPAGFGFEAFHRVFVDTGALLYVPPVDALRHSLLFALACVAIAVPLGALAARAAAESGPLLDAVWMLPLGASAVTLSLGLLLVFPWQAGPFGLDLRGTAAMLVLVHVLVAFPFVARAMTGPLRARDPALSDAARALGAKRWQRVLWIEAPLLSPALLVGAVLAASVSLGEFAGALILLRPEYATVPAEMYRYLSSTRPDPWVLPEAFALASMLMLLDLAIFALLERIRPGRTGGF
ncbi:MAG: thiamine transport system permease protein [Thermoplasmata archaeon]|jgi:thiamine transport system permease protein|nr:thiamine transport system permease protein [Thermoplasmata archaeon]